jgi:hypothetical protein
VQRQRAQESPLSRTRQLAEAIVRSLAPGNGRSNRTESEDELRERLDSDGHIAEDGSDE